MQAPGADNAMTIQGELQRVLETFFRQPLELTGLSRTDAGVHARQNFFHVDTALTLSEKAVYTSMPCCRRIQC